MDKKEHDALAEMPKPGINAAIVAIDEKTAFEAAQQITTRLLSRFAPSGQESPVDVPRLGERVIAELYTQWFGLPDGTHMLTGFGATPIKDLKTDPALCPRDFFFVARHNFGAYPADAEREKGVARGQAIQAAVRSYLEATPPGKLVCLSKTIYDKLVKKTANGPDIDDVVRTIGGVMLGFGPSVYLHFATVMREWVEMDRPDTRSVWDLQTQLLAVGNAPLGHADVSKVLRDPLIHQMCKEPIPSVIWREKPGSTLDPNGKEPAKTVLGLHGLMNNPAAEVLMFGGSRDPQSALHTVHACPGYGMATGVLLGIISTLLLAGTLRKTPSPSILMVVR
jgi:hypothetical protein